MLDFISILESLEEEEEVEVEIVKVILRLVFINFLVLGVDLLLSMKEKVKVEIEKVGKIGNFMLYFVIGKMVVNFFFGKFFRKLVEFLVNIMLVLEIEEEGSVLVFGVVVKFGMVLVG